MNVPRLQRREYESAAKWAAISFVLLTVLPLTAAGVFLASWLGLFIGLVFVPVLLLVFPLGCWRTVLVHAAERAFRHVILRKSHEALVKRFHIPLSAQSSYFLGPPGFPESIVWRLSQTISVVFLFASTATPVLATIRTPRLKRTGFLDSHYSHCHS